MAQIDLRYYLLRGKVCTVALTVGGRKDGKNLDRTGIV